jgi:hypothetical protein
MRDQAHGLVLEARHQVEEQLEEQAERVVEGLRRLGHEAGALLSGRPEDAETLGPYVRRMAARIDELADEVELRGIGGLVEEAEKFARRRPTAFLLGTAVAGFGVGRLLRASQASQEGGRR